MEVRLDEEINVQFSLRFLELATLRCVRDLGVIWFIY